MIRNFPYRDRHEAGEVLGEALREELGTAEAVVLALPRGGVPVGFRVAQALDAPLDVLLVQRLAVPGQPELAMGAISACGFEMLNQALVAEFGLTPFEIAAVADRELVELERREALYRQGRDALDFRGRIAVLVDDGLASAFTMRAAAAAVRECDPSRIVVAAPVGAGEACEEVAAQVSALVCPFRPSPFNAVGAWYLDYSPTTDEEVCDCVRAAARGSEASRVAHAH